MDLFSLAGIAFSLFTILVGQSLEGGTLVSLINLPALLIVLGGTIGAVMVETPHKVFVKAINILKWVVKPPNFDYELYIAKLVSWSEISKNQGVLKLEGSLNEETDELLQKGLALIVDGIEEKSLRGVLESEIECKVQNNLLASKVFESMGGYSPTIGIIGAVLGLIQVMSNLAEPDKLGTGIATAFVATIYGIGLANLFFLPVSSKLHTLILESAKVQEMILEGFLCISRGEHPKLIEMKLLGYIQ